MPRLDNLQRCFCDALREPSAPSPTLLRLLRDDDGLALQRFNIYRNNFIVLNGDALAEMYPVIRQLVGNEGFRWLATRYVRLHPPSERTLLLYGEHFADFLDGIPELSPLPYLADVARLEYAWTDAYHAEDVRPLSPHQITTIAPDTFARMHLQPHPGLHCIRSDYPILRIWKSNQPEAPQPCISLDEGGVNVLVTRPGLEVQMRTIPDAEATLLLALKQGATMGMALEAALRNDPGFDLADYLGRHLFDGTFSGIGSGPATQ